MHRRSPLVVSSVLAAALSACAFGATHLEVVGRTEDLQERADRVLRVPLDAAGLARVALETGNGSIEVTAGDADFEVTAELEIWGRTKEDADAALAGFALVAGRDGDAATVRLRGEPLTYRDGTSTMRVWPRARVKARLPRGLAVAAKTSSGDVRVVGPFGPCELTSSFGQLAAEGAADVTATTRSGDVDVRGASGDVRLRSSFGVIACSGVEARSLSAETQTGDVRLRDVAAASIVATSGHGVIDARRTSGNLQLTTTTGNITVEAGGDGTHRLETGHGRLSFRGGGGELTARSSSGDVEVATFTGSARLGTQHGTIEAQGVFTALHARSASGSVQATAADGSRAAAPWSLSSGHGHVELEVPADFACELVAATGHGRIASDARVTTAPGVFDGRSLRGTIGAGGSRVELTTTAGDVRLRTRGDAAKTAGQ